MVVGGFCCCLGGEVKKSQSSSSSVSNKDDLGLAAVVDVVAAGVVWVLAAGFGDSVFLIAAVAAGLPNNESSPSLFSSSLYLRK